MAYPTSIAYKPGVVESTSTAATVTLDPDRIYTVMNLGYDSSSVAAPSVTVFLAWGKASDYATAPTITTDYSGTNAGNKCPLIPGVAVQLGFDITQLSFKSASSQTLLITPGPQRHQR